MKQLGGVDKPRLETSETDRTWNDKDDKCHLAENEAWSRHRKVFATISADVDFACR